MPRKRALQFAKPVTVAHPSLTSSSNKEHDPRLPTTVPGTADRSVNDLIQHLRRSQICPNTPQRALHASNPHTVHPSLNAVLDIPDTPTPRPRPGMRVLGGRRARGPAGPPPPDSWLSATRQPYASAHTNGGRATKHTKGPVLRSLGSLPGLRLPHERSLLHLALKGLAQDWDWHKEYDQFYLASLPMRHKEALLSYIAFYNPQSIDCSGLEVLFLDDTELADATGSESLTHLDLASSVGYGIKPKDLKHILLKKSKVKAESITSPRAANVPESWDSPSPPSTALNAPTSVPRFPALTHLSLSHPAIPSWKHFLAVSPYLATLTHLSLAHWPIPSLTPNSTTAYRETPVGNIDYGGSNFYSVFDGDLSEAASVLRRLSKATYCLQWLDLTGCSDWVQAIGRKDGADWCGAWRGVEVVHIGQGWIPRCLEEEGSEWRRVLKFGAVSPESEEAPLMWAQKKELVAWANIEEYISYAERGVRSMTMQAKDPSSAGPKLENRSRTVQFERGWEGWWIEDALRYLNTMASTSASLS